MDHTLIRFRGINECTLIYFYETGNVGIFFFLMHSIIAKFIIDFRYMIFDQPMPPLSRRIIRTIILPPMFLFLC